MNQKGVTLIELISLMAIIAILTSLAAPSMSRMIARNEATTGINWIIGAVNFARHAAINYRVTMTLCPAKNTELICKGKWHDGLIIFADHNSDAKLNGRDYLLMRVHADNVSGTLKWRAFRNRQYLQMTQLGYTNYQNGNFVYCPPDQNVQFARQIVINVQGRARVLHTRNSDGYSVDRKGKVLRC